MCVSVDKAGYQQTAMTVDYFFSSVLSGNLVRWAHPDNFLALPNQRGIANQPGILLL